MRSLLDNGLARSEPGRALSQPTTQESDSAVASLKSGRLKTGAIVEDAPYPMAVWSLDRRDCIFNSLAKELLGLREDDIRWQGGDLYLERIEPEDRPAVLSAWKQLRDGNASTSCRYRLRSQGAERTRNLREISIVFPACGKDRGGVVTLYAEERKNLGPMGEGQPFFALIPAFTHEIGNNLQAIGGELELLRWSGILPLESAAIVSSGIRKIRNLARDIQEYFLPSSSEIHGEDLASVVGEILRGTEKESKTANIRTQITVQDRLPKVPLNGQLTQALKTIIEFSCALLSAGGHLTVEVGTCCRDGGNAIQLNVISASSCELAVEEENVFRPFLNLAGYRAGLSMAVAQRTLLRHSAEIVFRKEQPNRGVFSILMTGFDPSAYADAIA